MRRYLYPTFLFISVASLLLVITGGRAQTPSPYISGKYYRFDVVAATGQNGVTSLGRGASINDSGVVAFSGRTSGGRALFASNTAGAPRLISNGSAGLTGGEFGRWVQINNSDYVIAQESGFSSTGLTPRFISRFDARPVSPAQPVLLAASNAGTGLNDFNHIFELPSINNNNQAAFDTLRRTSSTTQEWSIVTGARPTFNQLAVPDPVNDTLLMVADNGDTVGQPRGTPSDPIRLYNYGLTTGTDIANSTMGFTALGGPGISDDGEAVAFYGVQGGTPGVFLNLNLGAGRQNYRVAGGRLIENPDSDDGNGDGVCDPAEQTLGICVAGELGFDEADTPLSFSAIENSRVAVVHQSFPPDGLEGDTLVLSFIGTPSAASNLAGPREFSNQRGLWTIRVDVRRAGSVLLLKPRRAIPVIQVGDVIDTRPITNLFVYDQLANARTNDGGAARTVRPGDHKVVFIASTSTGNIVVRGSHMDSDEDGLLEHWESSGIDFNLDRTPDLQLHLPPFNANPNHKDLFVEIDYMDGPATAAHRDHRPGDRALREVANVFKAAPVSNPDRVNGITLHNMLDEAVPEIADINFTNRVAGADNDFNDIKLGEPANPCSTAAAAGHFGTAAERSSPNCANIIGARRLVFRYGLFAHTFEGSTDTGLAELPGNDFIVTHGGLPDADLLPLRGHERTQCLRSENDLDCARRQFEKATYMHELGHTLGLRHGGEQHNNCKPNYLSVMSYSLIYPDFDSRRPLAYSRSQLRTLNENNLSEPLGVQGPAGRRTVYGYNGGLNYRVVPANQPINWNNDADSTDTGVVANVNFIVEATCEDDGLTELTGFNDWTGLQFVLRNAADSSDGPTRRTPGLITELNAAQLSMRANTLDEDGDGVVNANDNCLGEPNPDQTDSNGDGTGDVCELPATGSFSDLDISVTSSPEPAEVGAPLTYTLTVTNLGPDATTGVTVTAQLPPGVTFDSATAEQGSCSGTQPVTCNLGTVAADTSLTVNITVTPTSTGQLNGSASVTGEVFELDETNNDAVVISTIAAASTPPSGGSSPLLISEFRLRGPGGPADEFVELYNNTDAAITVNAADGSGGWALAALSADGASQSIRYVIPEGTVIPARGRYLIVNHNPDTTDPTPRYSLANYGGTGRAAGDGSYTADIADGVGVAVFRTADPASFTFSNRLDAVGFNGVGDPRFREGAGLQPSGGVTANLEFSFSRKQCDFVVGVGCTTPGLPKDAHDNAADFVFVDTEGNNVGAGQRLGAPGPENLASPVLRNATIGFDNIDRTVSASSPPNRIRDFTGDPANNSTFGTLTLRRRVTNNTGAPVTRLRFRIIEMTTFPSPAGTADLRARSSTDVMATYINDTATCGANPTPCTVAVGGTVVEAPPSQPNGGGINSSMAAGTVTLNTPLANGQSVNVQFLLGIQQTGSFRFLLNIEALP